MRQAILSKTIRHGNTILQTFCYSASFGMTSGCLRDAPETIVRNFCARYLHSNP